MQIVFSGEYSGCERNFARKRRKKKCLLLVSENGYVAAITANPVEKAFAHKYGKIKFNLIIGANEEYEEREKKNGDRKNI